METMLTLNDLLKHEITDLYSVEQQIIDALPKMIESATNKQLKAALNDHLALTRKHKERLDKIKGMMEITDQEKGFFSTLFGSSEEGSEHCKGMEGLIKEGNKLLGEDMTEEVKDAAIIAAAQKVEHYEICGYGTARAYALELNLNGVAALLEQTLNEEYDTDDLLTTMALGRINEDAISNSRIPDRNRTNGKAGNSSSKGNSNQSTKSPSAGSNGRSKTAGKSSSPIKTTPKKAAPKKAEAKKATSKKTAPNKTTGKKSSPKKAAAKKASPKKLAGKKVLPTKKTATVLLPFKYPSEISAR